MTTDERMKKMEGQLARVRWINCCLIACIVLSFGVFFISKTFGPKTVWAQAGVKEIRANSFVLEDENGKTRVLLSSPKEGPVLGMLDENGQARVGLSVYKNGPVLKLYDENGKSRAWLSVDKDGPALGLGDENGKVRASLVVVNKVPIMLMYDENGKIRTSMAVSKEVPTLLQTRDENEKLIWSAP